jgi:hypothetical protein
VVPADSFMDFSKESDSIFLRYAPLEHSCGAALVELPIDYREGLGAPHDLAAMDRVFWKLAPQQVGQIWLCPCCFDEYDCARVFWEVFCSCCLGGAGLPSPRVCC